MIFGDPPELAINFRIQDFVLSTSGISNPFRVMVMGVTHSLFCTRPLKMMGVTHLLLFAPGTSGISNPFLVPDDGDDGSDSPSIMIARTRYLWHQQSTSLYQSASHPVPLGSAIIVFVPDW